MTSPHTLAGLWLRASALNQPEVRETLRLRMADFGGWSVGDVELLRACLGAFAREFFTELYDVRQVGAFVTEIVSYFGATVPDPLEMEAIIRAELGETDVEVDDISLRTVMMASSLAIVLVVRQNQIREVDVDRLIVAGEEMAAERGWRPRPG